VYLCKKTQFILTYDSDFVEIDQYRMYRQNHTHTYYKTLTHTYLLQNTRQALFAIGMCVYVYVRSRTCSFKSRISSSLLATSANLECSTCNTRQALHLEWTEAAKKDELIRDLQKQVRDVTYTYTHMHSTKHTADAAF